MSVLTVSLSHERAPLLGHNLVRLLYLDEAGSDFRAPYLCVAGVLVHGDSDWPEVDRRIATLIEKHVAPQDRLGFYFHAKDIFHGSGYFHRQKPEWAEEAKRHAVLCELAQIIDDINLPIVCGQYSKGGFGSGFMPPDEPQHFKHNLIHTTAATDCLTRADGFLAKYAPSELATVIHEDGPAAKKLIKHVVRMLRNGELLDDWMSKEQQDDVHPPLKRIIDTVHFAEKHNARALQLADLCAFSIARMSNEKLIPPYVRHVIAKNVSWVNLLYAASYPPSEKGDSE
ncbi:DUF3800 domain-containing protein [Methylocapsa sp. D3K7]|uniref:DUF3800 domain-containing protein n=1 Tax=Methylocapsa sp. D3K7 TaxID=3041435 RepID=UPI00244EEFE6|nr:DUF3800 domain-containing protein [Methylocapsa sp. D3K7]WGJ15501.1 DUF3800 domain-containing protein [Methylocapsa sp. D3K7]